LLTDDDVNLDSHGLLGLSTGATARIWAVDREVNYPCLLAAFGDSLKKGAYRLQYS
jgi:hypothetical protein